jgi:hypothetical protein
MRRLCQPHPLASKALRGPNHPVRDTEYGVTDPGYNIVVGTIDAGFLDITG